MIKNLYTYHIGIFGNIDNSDRSVFLWLLRLKKYVKYSMFEYGGSPTGHISAL
jgi:hypothetical protein